MGTRATHLPQQELWAERHDGERPSYPRGHQTTTSVDRHDVPVHVSTREVVLDVPPDFREHWVRLFTNVHIRVAVTTWVVVVELLLCEFQRIPVGLADRFADRSHDIVEVRTSATGNQTGPDLTLVTDQLLHAHDDRGDLTGELLDRARCAYEDGRQILRHDLHVATLLSEL